MCYSHSKEHPLPTGKKTLTIDVATILSQRVGMFSHRKDCNEALEYAQSLLLGDSTPAAVSTAIMVYHNTLLNALANGAYAKEVAQSNLPTHMANTLATNEDPRYNDSEEHY